MSKNTVHYYPYGKVLREWNPQAEKYLTTHHERDKETGLDYRGARYYDSDDSRLLSLDPLQADFPSWSPYCYVLGNPLAYTDPDGRKPDDYTIKQNGSIEVKKTDDKFDRFFIENKKGNIENLGQFDKNSKGLIQMPSEFSFNSSDANSSFGFSVKSGNENRSYIRGDAFAALMGALSETNTLDMSVIGFSLKDGASPSPSVSHKDGKNGDLRYLSNDYSGKAVLLGSQALDISRQSNLNVSLSKYGWKDMISEKFTPFGSKSSTLLPNTSSAKERGIGSDHTNHLHLQGFKPNLIFK